MKVAELLLIFTTCLFIFSVEQSQAQYGLQISQSVDCGQITESQDPRTKVPWVVGIFARYSSKRPWNYFISGAILDPTTIVTVLGGVYGQTTAGLKYSIPSPSRHMIVAGLKSSRLEDIDEHSQEAEVSYILPQATVDPENGNYHLFIFRLKTPLNLTGPYVRAACIPAFLKYVPKEPFKVHDNGFQGGFSATSDQSLTSLTTQFESNEFCKENFQLNNLGDSKASHVYCGRTSADSNGQCVSYGSSLMYFVHGRWFVIGLTALHPTPPTALNWCHSDTVYFYANFHNAIYWILDNLRCSSNEFSCGGRKCIKLDQVCDMTNDCGPEGSEDEDPIFCRARKPCLSPAKSFECGVYGPCLPPAVKCDGKPDCPGGEDEAGCDGEGELTQVNKLSVHYNAPTLLQLKESTTARPSDIAVASRNGQQCPPLQSTEGVVIECTDASGKGIPCERAEAMTTAKLKCKRLYTSTSPFPSITMTCSESGKWRPYKNFACEPQCGIRTDKIKQSYIIQGQAALADQEPFPWHAAIFQNRRNQMQYICGGSLIQKSLIVTAAHCVADMAGSVQPAQLYKIVLGGNSSKFDENQRDKNAQIFGVKTISIPNSYDRQTFQGDIALVQLDAEAKYGDLVRPVCALRRTFSALPAPGTYGAVPGYGYTQEQTIAARLQFANIPVIPPAECAGSLKKKPPLKTFCAGYKNGTTVCQGDSGGGLVFVETSEPVEVYFLKGIVSHGDAKEGHYCDPNNYAVFTHVDEYADWIFQKIESINPSRKIR